MRGFKRIMITFVALMALVAVMATAVSASPAIIRERGVTYNGSVDSSAPYIYLFPNTTGTTDTLYAKITNVNPYLIQADYYIVNGSQSIYLGTMNPSSMTGGISYWSTGWIFMVKITSLADPGVSVPYSITFY